MNMKSTTATKTTTNKTKKRTKGCAYFFSALKINKKKDKYTENQTVIDKKKYCAWNETLMIDDPNTNDAF